MERLDDMSLVARVAVFGDKRAFDSLVRKYQSPVRRFLLSLTSGDSQLSDDLAQGTFIKAYTNIGRFRGLSSLQTWLFRIAYNTHFDYLRSLRRTEDMDSLAPQAVSATACEPRGTAHIDIYSALALLGSDERTCITLQLVDGYAIKDISEITGMPQGTVKSHLSRGKEKITRYLTANGYERRK